MYNILLSVLIVVIICLFLLSFRSSFVSNNENYSNSYNNIYDSYVNPYSRDIKISPSVKNELSTRIAKIKNDGTSYITDASLSNYLSIDDSMNNFMNNDPTNKSYELSDLEGVIEDIDAANLVDFSVSENRMNLNPTQLSNQKFMYELRNDDINNYDNSETNIIKNAGNDEVNLGEKIIPFVNMNDDYDQSLKLENKNIMFIKDDTKCPMFDDKCINDIPYENINDVLDRHRIHFHDAIGGAYKNVKKDIF